MVKIYRYYEELANSSSRTEVFELLMTNVGFYFVVTICWTVTEKKLLPGLLHFGPLEEFINYAFREEVPVDPLPHLMQSSRRV